MLQLSILSIGSISKAANKLNDLFIERTFANLLNFQYDVIKLTLGDLNVYHQSKNLALTGVLMSGQYIPPPSPGALTIQVLPEITMSSTWYLPARTFLHTDAVTPFDYIATIARSNNISEMRNYLNQGGDINLSSSTSGASLLSHALRYGASLDMIQFFLAQPNINIEQPDSAGETAIFAALRRKTTGSTRAESVANAREKLQIIDAVLNKQPNLRVQNRNGDTALIFAVKENLEIFKRVLANDPPLFIKNLQRESALTIAARGDVAQKVFLLFQRIQPADRAELNARDQSNRSFLRLATSHASPRIVTTVLETYQRCAVALSPSDFCEAWLGLPRIQYRGDENKMAKQILSTIRVAELLFKAGARLNDVDPVQRATPLMIAIENGHWDLALHFLHYPVSLQQPAINCESICARQWNALCYLVQAIKDMSVEDFDVQRVKMALVYHQVLQRMSEAAIQHTAVQMNIPLARLQTQDINTLRLFIPPVGAIAVPAQQVALGAGVAAQPAVAAPVLVDSQSTHRREVHHTTTLCARTLYARHANSLNPARVKYIEVQFQKYYMNLAWLSDHKRNIYVQNLERAVGQPIPGDESGEVKRHLTEKLDWIKGCAQASRQAHEQYHQLLQNAVVTEGEAESVSNAQENHQQFMKQRILLDWATSSVLIFLKYVFGKNPYSEWQDPDSGVTVAQALVLLWSAIDDPRYALTVDQKNDLRVQIGLVIIDAIHENGPLHTSCAPGAFNALMDTAARSGYIPGLYVLSNAAEGASIKLQIAQKLSMRAQFEMLNAEQKILWFESKEIYEAAQQNCAKEQQAFYQFGENQDFKIFTEAELYAFNAELALSWEQWVAQYVDQRPTIEALAISRLNGMSETTRKSILSRKRKASEEGPRDLLKAAGRQESAVSFEPVSKRRKRTHAATAVEPGAAMDQSADRDDTAQAAASAITTNQAMDIDGMMDQLDEHIGPLLRAGSGADDFECMDLDTLVGQIAAVHPALVHSQYDRSVIQQHFGMQAAAYTLIDYTSQAEEIRQRPDTWVNKHWHEYYTELKQEALNALLPQVGFKPIGNLHADLRYYAERDLERVLQQCSLNQADESGKIICDQYAVWLQSLVEQPELSPGMQA